MKKLILHSMVAIAALNLSSCVEKDFEGTGNSTEPNSSIDQSFKFSTRTSCNLKLTAINPQGKPATGAKFSIYDKDPSTDDGRDMSIVPIYQAYTDKNGVINSNIEISAITEKLYIYPEMSGLGVAKVVTPEEAAEGIEFKGPQLPLTSKIATRATGDVIERTPNMLGVNYYFYDYFTEDEINRENGILNIGNGLVDMDPLSNEYINRVNAMFPETAFYTEYKKSTDLIISDENGAEAWVTYIGDGGFCLGNNNKKFRNGLFYYTYTKENAPTKKYDGKNKNEDRHITAIFPNVNPYDNIITGTRVQLLYYNEATGKYTNIFPKGTHIGFILNYKGYNKEKKIDAYGYSYGNEEGAPYFTTKECNTDQNTHGIAIWDEQYKCYTLGMERAGTRTGNADNDFNDILAKLTFSPAKKQEQRDTINPPAGLDPIYSSREGTLAFEDNWPASNQYDYDFNDFVCSYKYTLVKDAITNKVEGINLTFKPKAVGAKAKDGFGIQLPIASDNVASIIGANIEEGNDLATLILFEDVHTAFGITNDFANTYLGKPQLTAEEINISIELKNAVSEEDASLSKFNPFITRDSRDKEIHLVDYAPTQKMTTKYFGQGDDKSNPSLGLYYRKDNIYPWALDISDINWEWPTETTNINKLYPEYESWYQNGQGAKSWMLNEKSENAWQPAK